MNVKTRYDNLITQIEIGAKNPDIDANTLMDSVTRASGFSTPELNTAFRFITDETLLQYIKTRKLMAAYKYLLEADPSKISSPRAISYAVSISGYDNQNSFTKKFSQFFNKLTPKEAFLKKDLSLLTEPLTWAVVSDESALTLSNKEEDLPMVNTLKFGISQEQYTKVIEAHEFSLLYNLPEMFNQVAFEISEQLGVTMKNAFAYADSLYDYGDEFSYDPDPEEDEEQLEDPEDELREVAFDPFVQFAFFKCHLSVYAAYELRDRLCFSEDSIMTMDPKLLHAFAQTYDMNFNFFKQAYEYYQQHATDNFTKEQLERYIDLLEINTPIEIAFREIAPFTDDFDFCYEVPLSGDDDSLPDIIEQMASEDRQWSNVRIDIELDEDNIAYELEDIDDPNF